MTLPRSALQADLHGLLCKRHSRDPLLRSLVRSMIREDIQRLRGMRRPAVLQ